jgi:hypothetical protein
VAGQTESGTLGGPLGSLRVVCMLGGPAGSATILGLTSAGSSQALISVSVMGPAPYSVNLEEQVGSAFYEYTDIKNGGAVPAGDATVSGTTVHLSATVTEDGSPTALPSPLTRSASAALRHAVADLS